MTSRQRVAEALLHRRTDRLPIDLGATNATGIHNIVYRALKKQLGLDGAPVRVFDIIGQLAEVELPVLERLGGDVVMLRRMAPSLGIPVRSFVEGVNTLGESVLVADAYRPRNSEKGDLEICRTIGDDQIHPFKPGDASGDGAVIARCPRGAHSFSRVLHPLADVDGVDELDDYIFPEITQEELRFLSREAERLYTETDKAVCGVFGGNIFETGQLYWGYATFFEYLAGEPELMMHFLQRRTDAFMRDLEKYLDAVGAYIHVIDFWDDLGTQRGLMISPRMYKDMIKPFHTRLYRYVRERYPHIGVFLHSCGAVYDLIPDLIEAGVQILNPVQFTADGMDPRRLKQNFGGELTFWGGGVDTQNVLNRATPAEVSRMAAEMSEIFAPGGGFVFSQVHNIDENVPAGNVIAAFDTAKNFKLV